MSQSSAEISSVAGIAMRVLIELLSKVPNVLGHATNTLASFEGLRS